MRIIIINRYFQKIRCIDEGMLDLLLLELLIDGNLK